MSNYQPVPNDKDPLLWNIAQRRAGFKKHLLSYIVLNAFFWLLWNFSGEGRQSDDFIPWRAWSMLGWGIGLLFHFMGAYVFHGSNQVEKEYQKLKEQHTK